MTDFTQLCKDLEHYETPEWAALAILEKEVCTQLVFDPCCGTGVLSKAAAHHNNYVVQSIDIHDWGYPLQTQVDDFLLVDEDFSETTVFMNPPFSKACEFVEKSIELGARKIVCFQRFAWWESKTRREFWKKNPPSRVYICGDRASCWRHDLPKDDKGNRFDPKTGKKLSNSPTAHAWFVWDRDAPYGTLLGHIYKGDV